MVGRSTGSLDGMAIDHIQHLGKLVGNLQSLEAMLRLFLAAVAKKQQSLGKVGQPDWNLAVGDVVPEDAFTNYDSLGVLISKYNANIANRDKALVVDAAVVSVRDLIAHGRVAADWPDPAHLRILKFEQPSGGSVKVVASELMSDAWFNVNNDLVRAQLRKVHKAYEAQAV